MKKILIGLLFFQVFVQTDAMAVDSLTMEEKEATTALMSDPLNPELLKKYDEEVRENPSSCKRRWQRSLILLKHGQFNENTGEDIDTLLQHPIWRTQGERLKAMHLYLQGHVVEAETLMRQNIRNNVNIVEQSRLLAGIQLSRKDTVAAIAVYRFAWDQNGSEDVYVELLNSYRGHGKPPEKLLQKGLQLFPRNPGVLQTIFGSYFASAQPADLKKCREISARAEKVLWPRSIDWKIKHAQVLLALKRPREAEPVLLATVDLMDEDPRLEGENGSLRKQVFALLETARK